MSVEHFTSPLQFLNNNFKNTSQFRYNSLQQLFSRISCFHNFQLFARLVLPFKRRMYFFNSIQSNETFFPFFFSPEKFLPILNSFLFPIKDHPSKVWNINSLSFYNSKNVTRLFYPFLTCGKFRCDPSQFEKELFFHF